MQERRNIRDSSLESNIARNDPQSQPDYNPQNKNGQKVYENKEPRRRIEESKEDTEKSGHFSYSQLNEILMIKDID